MNNQNIINEIRSKINIVDIVNEYVPLTKKGNNYWGKCPFHNDNNPSMCVNETKQMYTCWSCKNSGNVFKFYEQIENISFYETLKRLGERVGINVSKSDNIKTNTKFDKYYEIYDIANKYYQLMLNTEKGISAKEYLKKRGIGEDIIKEFGIGLALKDKNKLIDFLKEKKYDINTLNELGLANNEIDTFIDRIIFPLDDRNGRIVGFSGRIYNNNTKMAKYMNSKETPIFKKGMCLYHYNASKEYVREKKYVIVMEGFMDVIRASSVGIKNTVALMGTSLTEDTISLLKKLSQNVYLCLDGDEPGQENIVKNGKLLENAGLTVKVICLTNNEDPDSYILKYGVEKFNSLIDNALNYSEFKINRLKNNINFGNDQELSNYINNVLKEIVDIKEEIRCEIILKKLAKETNLSYNTLEKKFNEYKSLDKKDRDNFKNNIIKQEDKGKNKYIKACEEFIYYMLINPKIIKVYDTKKIFFINPVYRSIAALISSYYHEYGEIVIADFYTYLIEKKELLDTFNTIQNLDLNDDISDRTVLEYIKVINDYNVQDEIKKLELSLRKAIDEEEKINILERIRMLKIGECKDD